MRFNKKISVSAYCRYVFYVMCFMFLVSYKIMEPEMQHKSFWESETVEYPWQGERVQQLMEQNMAYIGRQMLDTNLNREVRSTLVDEQIAKFQLNQDYREPKPWEAANNLVMRFGILSSDPVELGR